MTLLKTLGLAALGTVLAFGARAQDKLPDSIKIATEGAYAPFNFMTPSGKLDGFEVELAAALCERIKVKCEVVAQDWDGIVPALQARKYDAIMAGMNVTEKRKEVMDFSRPYSTDTNGFMVESTNPLAKLPLDGQKFDLSANPTEAQKAVDAMKPMLKGKTVGVQVATIHANFMNKYLKDVVEVREYKTTEQHDLDLAAGRLDAIFASDVALRGTLAKPEFAKGYALVGPRLRGDVFGGGVAVGMRKNEPELHKAFDDAIAAMAADGSLKALSMKWFKTDISPQG